MDNKEERQTPQKESAKSKKRGRKPEETPANTTSLARREPEVQREQEAEFARMVHGPITGSLVYTAVSKHLQQCAAFEETAQQFTADFIERVAPRDPLEELLALQMLYTHGRVGYLSTQATQQRDPKKVKVYHEAADGASNTFRKLMLGLAQYRRPPRGGDTFMAIRQANVAEQQVVQNQAGARPRGVTHVCEPEPIGRARPAPQAPLPALAGGAGVAEDVGAAAPAVGDEHGAPNRGRQGPGEDERVPARGPVRRGRGKA